MFTYNTKWCGLVPLGCGSNNELSALSLYLSIYRSLYQLLQVTSSPGMKGIYIYITVY